VQLNYALLSCLPIVGLISILTFLHELFELIMVVVMMMMMLMMMMSTAITGEHNCNLGLLGLVNRVGRDIKYLTKQ